MPSNAERCIFNIDSEVASHQLLEVLLKTRGHADDCIVASYDPESARQTLDEFPNDKLPRLIIFRFNADVESGLAFLKELEGEQSRYKDIPLILLYEEKTSEIEEYLGQENVVFSMQFPYDAQALRDRVIELLESE